MPAFRLYHNPRCSKSRQTLALLAEHNINVTPILYLQEGLTEIQILTLQKKLKLSSLLSMMRPKEQEFVAQGLSKTSDEASVIKRIISSSETVRAPYP